MNLRATLNKWQPKLRAYFSTFPWKNMLIFVFFLVLAFIFWLMLFFQQEKVEGSYTIPLKYVNIPNDIVFNNPLPDKIEILLSDKGSEIFKYDFRKRDTIDIDIMSLMEDNVDIIQGSTYIQMIRTRISTTSNLIQYYPPTISIESSKLESKELLVVFDGEVNTSNSSLVADTITFLPEKVTAYGSGEKLKTLDSAITEYSVFENLKATSQLHVKIKPIEGIKFVPSEVEAFIPIYEYTEKYFEIPVECKNAPKNINVKFFPSKVNVSFAATLEEYKKIEADDFKVILDYNQLNKTDSSSIALELTTYPSNVRNIRISPTSAEFLFEKK